MDAYGLPGRLQSRVICLDTGIRGMMKFTQNIRSNILYTTIIVHNKRFVNFEMYQFVSDIPSQEALTFYSV